MKKQILTKLFITVLTISLTTAFSCAKFSIKAEKPVKLEMMKKMKEKPLEERSSMNRTLWHPKASMPIVKDNFGYAAVGGKIYTFGGYSTELPWGTAGIEAWTDEVTEYDPEYDTWKIKSSMSTGRIDMGFAVWNNKVYIIGGRTPKEGNGTDTVEVYDPSTDTWTKKAPMPTARWGLGCAVLNGKIYAIGGTKANGVKRDMEIVDAVEVYDPETNSWKRMNPMPNPRFGIACAAVKDRIYVFGGAYSIVDKSDLVEEYDPSNDSWTELRPMSVLRSRSRCMVFDEQIYLFGGDSSHREVAKYNPADDLWKTVTRMLIDRHIFGCVLIDNSIYVFGGYSPSKGRYINNMEAANMKKF